MAQNLQRYFRATAPKTMITTQRVASGRLTPLSSFLTSTKIWCGCPEIIPHRASQLGKNAVLLQYYKKLELNF